MCSTNTIYLFKTTKADQKQNNTVLFIYRYFHSNFIATKTFNLATLYCVQRRRSNVLQLRQHTLHIVSSNLEQINTKLKSVKATK